MQRCSTSSCTTSRKTFRARATLPSGRTRWWEGAWPSSAAARCPAARFLLMKQRRWVGLIEGECVGWSWISFGSDDDLVNVLHLKHQKCEFSELQVEYIKMYKNCFALSIDALSVLSLAVENHPCLIAVPSRIVREIIKRSYNVLLVCCSYLGYSGWLKGAET